MGKFFFPCTFTVENVAETLDKDMSGTQHVGQLSHLLSILNGLVKGIVKIMGAKNGNIGISGFFVLIGMSVYHGQVVIIVFLADETAGILAEGSNLVFKGLGIPDELGLIKHVVNLFDYLVSNLNPHSDVHSSGLMSDIVLGTDFLQPFGTSSAGCNYRFIGCYFNGIIFACYIYSVAGVSVKNNVGTFVPEKNLHPVILEPMFKGKIELLRLFCSQMANRTVNKLKTRLNSPFADFLNLFGIFNAFDVLVGTKLKINFIGIINGFLCKIFSDERGQISPNLITQRKLPAPENPVVM